MSDDPDRGVLPKVLAKLAHAGLGARSHFLFGVSQPKECVLSSLFEEPAGAAHHADDGDDDAHGAGASTVAAGVTQDDDDADTEPDEPGACGIGFTEAMFLYVLARAKKKLGKDLGDMEDDLDSDEELELAGTSGDDRAALFCRYSFTLGAGARANYKDRGNQRS